MSDDPELTFLDGNGVRMRDVAEERTRRIIEASRPLAELLAADQRLVVPPELQITREGIYDGMPEAIYRADPVPGGSLTRSGAMMLLPPSCPAKFDYALKHPRTDSTEAFDLGHAAHHMVLGIGPELVDVGGDDFRVPKVKARYDEVRARGGVPLRTRQWKQVMEMAAALRAHPEAAALLNPDHGKPEQALFWTETVYWEDPTIGTMREAEIWRRSLIDWLPDRPDRGRLIVPDYKTARSAHQKTWARSAADYGYHLQDSWITEGLHRLLDVDVAVIFILQEKEPPYLVSIAEMGSHEKQVGREKSWQALELFAECRRTDMWPGYPTIEEVQIPWIDYK